LTLNSGDLKSILGIFDYFLDEMGLDIYFFVIVVVALDVRHHWRRFLKN